MIEIIAIWVAIAAVVIYFFGEAARMGSEPEDDGLQRISDADVAELKDRLL